MQAEALQAEYEARIQSLKGLKVNECPRSRQQHHDHQVCFALHVFLNYITRCAAGLRSTVSGCNQDDQPDIMHAAHCKVVSCRSSFVV